MFVRSPHNPILTVADIPWGANSVFNPGASLMPDGSVSLLIRVEDRRGLSSIHVARSLDGTTDWEIDSRPLLQPDSTNASWEWGFEDARLVWVDDLSAFVVTCTAYGRNGPCVYLAKASSDLRSIEPGMVVIAPEDKNAAVFPRRIDGQWLMLHRPVVMSNNSADIWISRSDDMAAWREPEPVLHARTGAWWDAARIGIGPPPIETPHGWLLLYHGVRNTMSGAIYRVGAALLDTEQPWIVRSRLDEWLLGPAEPYERTGDVGNVVFPVGAVTRADQVT